MKSWRLTAIVLSGLALSFCLAVRGTGAPPVIETTASNLQPKYRVTIATLVAGWETVRWNVRTGETWRLVQSNWARLENTDPPQLGDYEVITFVTTTNTWGATLVDRASGAAWELTDKWNKVGEPK